jgi:hypothetical protein
MKSDRILDWSEDGCCFYAADEDTVDKYHSKGGVTTARSYLQPNRMWDARAWKKIVSAALQAPKQWGLASLSGSEKTTQVPNNRISWPMARSRRAGRPISLAQWCRKFMQATKRVPSAFRTCSNQMLIHKKP